MSGRTSAQMPIKLLRLTRPAGWPITDNYLMNTKVIILIVGAVAFPLAKLVGLLGEKPWTDAWLFAGAAVFGLAFIMYAGFRSRVLTYGGKMLKAMAAMRVGQKPVG